MNDVSLRKFLLLACAFLGMLFSPLPLRADHTDYFTGQYDFNRQVNDEAAAEGWKTSIYDHLTGTYQIVREFSDGGYLQIDFNLVMDARGKLLGDGDFYYEADGLEIFGPCTVSGLARGILDNANLLSSRVSLLVRYNGTANYNGATVPANGTLTARLFGDYEGPASDPVNYLDGTATLKISLPRILSIRYSNFSLDFDTPMSLFDPGTWILDTEVFQHGNFLSGTAWMTLANDRVLEFDLQGFYDPFHQEFVYSFRGFGSSAGNFFRLVETWDGSGYFISFMTGRVLQNYINY